MSCASRALLRGQLELRATGASALRSRHRTGHDGNLAGSPSARYSNAPSPTTSTARRRGWMRWWRRRSGCSGCWPRSAGRSSPAPSPAASTPAPPSATPASPGSARFRRIGRRVALAWLFRERDPNAANRIFRYWKSHINAGCHSASSQTNRIESDGSDFNTYKVARPAILFSIKMRMWQGAVGVAPEDGHRLSPDYDRCAPTGSIEPQLRGPAVSDTPAFSAECARRIARASCGIDFAALLGRLPRDRSAAAAARGASARSSPTSPRRRQRSTRCAPRPNAPSPFSRNAAPPSSPLQ